MVLPACAIAVLLKLRSFTDFLKWSHASRISNTATGSIEFWPKCATQSLIDSESQYNTTTILDQKLHQLYLVCISDVKQIGFEIPPCPAPLKVVFESESLKVPLQWPSFSAAKLRARTSLLTSVTAAAAVSSTPSPRSHAAGETLTAPRPFLPSRVE